MKKPVILTWVMVLLVVSFGLVGCGGDKKGPGGAEPAAKQESVTDLLAKGRNLPGYTCDFVVTMPEAQMNGKMWVSVPGKKMKMETVTQGQRMIMIVNGTDNVAYSYLPDQNMAMKITFDPAKTTKTPDQYVLGVDAAKVKVLESTTYEGVRCKVLQVQDTDNKIETKMWVREDNGLPVRVETTDSGKRKTVMEYKNLKVGPVPDNTFVLPAGVQINDMGGMMNKRAGRP